MFVLVNFLKFELVETLFPKVENMYKTLMKQAISGIKMNE